MELRKTLEVLQTELQKEKEDVLQLQKELQAARKQAGEAQAERERVEIVLKQQEVRLQEEQVEHQTKYNKWEESTKKLRARYKKEQEDAKTAFEASLKKLQEEQVRHQAEYERKIINMQQHQLGEITRIRRLQEQEVQQQAEAAQASQARVEQLQAELVAFRQEQNELTHKLDITDDVLTTLRDKIASLLNIRGTIDTELNDKAIKDEASLARKVAHKNYAEKIGNVNTSLQHLKSIGYIYNEVVEELARENKFLEELNFIGDKHREQNSREPPDNYDPLSSSSAHLKKYNIKYK